MWKLNLSKIKKCSEWKIMRACIGIGNWNDQLRCSALSTGIPGSQESGVSQGIGYWEVFCLFSLSQSTRWQNCRRGVLLYSFHQQIGSLEHIRGLVRPFSSGIVELRPSLLFRLRLSREGCIRNEIWPLKQGFPGQLLLVNVALLDFVIILAVPPISKFFSF